MVKLLVLQQWHGLSDPEHEKQVTDRISFRKFPRLSKIKNLIYLVRGKRQSKQVMQWKKVSKREYREYNDPGDPKKWRTLLRAKEMAKAEIF
jgi:hypothetical protein